jgi:hypothetical protein
LATRTCIRRRPRSWRAADSLLLPVLLLFFGLVFPAGLLPAPAHAHLLSVERNPLTLSSAPARKAGSRAGRRWRPLRRQQNRPTMPVHAELRRCRPAGEAGSCCHLAATKIKA